MLPCCNRIIDCIASFVILGQHNKSQCIQESIPIHSTPHPSTFLFLLLLLLFASQWNHGQHHTAVKVRRKSLSEYRGGIWPISPKLCAICSRLKPGSCVQSGKRGWPGGQLHNTLLCFGVYSPFSSRNWMTSLFWRPYSVLVFNIIRHTPQNLIGINVKFIFFFC